MQYHKISSIEFELFCGLFSVSDLFGLDNGCSAISEINLDELLFLTGMHMFSLYFLTSS